MTRHLLDALPIIGKFVLYAAGAFPLAAIRLGGRIGDDLRTMLDNRRART